MHFPLGCIIGFNSALVACRNNNVRVFPSRLLLEDRAPTAAICRPAPSCCPHKKKEEFFQMLFISLLHPPLHHSIPLYILRVADSGAKVLVGQNSRLNVTRRCDIDNRSANTVVVVLLQGAAQSINETRHFSDSVMYRDEL